MSSYTIEIVDDNALSAGWLAYVLGLPRLGDDPLWLDGWDMGQQTASLDAVRYVFEKQQTLPHPQYRVRSGEQHGG